jgi:hypothetical protein
MVVPLAVSRWMRGPTMSGETPKARRWRGFSMRHVALVRPLKGHAGSSGCPASGLQGTPLPLERFIAWMGEQARAQERRGKRQRRAVGWRHLVLWDATSASPPRPGATVRVCQPLRAGEADLSIIAASTCLDDCLSPRFCHCSSHIPRGLLPSRLFLAVACLFPCACLATRCVTLSSHDDAESFIMTMLITLS